MRAEVLVQNTLALIGLIYAKKSGRRVFGVCF